MSEAAENLKQRLSELVIERAEKQQAEDNQMPKIDFNSPKEEKPEGMNNDIWEWIKRKKEEQKYIPPAIRYE